MHNEVLSPEELRLPIPTDEEITRGNLPMDVEAIYSELEKIGATDHFVPHEVHRNYIIDRIFRIGDRDVGNDNHALQEYQFPWLDPGTCRWKRRGKELWLAKVMACAIDGLSRNHPERYNKFEAVFLEECIRISDTRNPIAARTLAFLVCILMRVRNNCLYGTLESLGIVQATLLAPHSVTIQFMLERTHWINHDLRLISRIKAYLLKALKRPNADQRWPIIAHYLAGLSRMNWNIAGFRSGRSYCNHRECEKQTFEFVKRIVNDHLKAIGQELEAEYKLLELDDPYLARLQRISKAQTIDRQDDDAVMGIDPSLFLRVHPESSIEDDYEHQDDSEAGEGDSHDYFALRRFRLRRRIRSLVQYQPLIANIKAFKKAHPSIDKFHTKHYIKTSLHLPRTDMAVLNEYISPTQWHAVARQWPELGASHVAEKGSGVIQRALEPLSLSDNSEFEADLLYAFHLVNYGRVKIDPSFQAAMKALFPLNYQAGEIKSIGRTFAKATHDYREREQPRAASVRDIVRCTLIFKNCWELTQAYRSLEANCVVLGVKNLFADETCSFSYGYRQILVSVLHEAPCGAKMIAEVQMHLESFARVRKQLRLYYEIERCGTWMAMRDLVGPESRHTYQHLGE